MMQVTLGRLLLESGVDGSEQAVQELIERDEVDTSVREFLTDTMRTSG